jgi:copper chaperone CopZ
MRRGEPNRRGRMKIEMKFQGMTCLECAHNLENALRSVPGVENVER